jgi:hypothetical protein
VSGVGQKALIIHDRRFNPLRHLIESSSEVTEFVPPPGKRRIGSRFEVASTKLLSCMVETRDRPCEVCRDQQSEQPGDPRQPRKHRYAPPCEAVRWPRNSHQEDVGRHRVGIRVQGEYRRLGIWQDDSMGPGLCPARDYALFAGQSASAKIATLFGEGNGRAVTTERPLLCLQGSLRFSANYLVCAGCYGVRTKPSRASASYSLCLLQPLLMVAAT